MNVCVPQFVVAETLRFSGVKLVVAISRGIMLALLERCLGG